VKLPQVSETGRAGLQVGPSRTPVAELLGGMVILGLASLLWLGPASLTPIFWSGVIPLVPVLLLVHPALWRNVCPLSLASTGSADLPRLEQRPRIGLAILFFLALLPVRSAILGTGGGASAVALVGLLGLAVVFGRRRPHRSGFCTAWCPMLPVEILYGQAPLIEVPNYRCHSCSVCTPRACPDLSVQAAIAQHLGTERNTDSWTLQPFGAFAAAFPGVIAAFFLQPDAAGADAALLWMTVGGLLSWTLTTVLVLTFRPPWRVAIRLLGGACAALWTWFAIPNALGVLMPWVDPVTLTLAARLFGAGLVLYWMTRSPATSPGGTGRAKLGLEQ